MSKATWRSPEGRRQAAALALLSLVPIVAASLLYPSHSGLFRRYFGDVDALAAVALITIAGAAAWVLLRTYGGFRIYEAKRAYLGIGLSAILATTFVAGAIAVDVAIGFPRELNVPLPWSVLFYPAMGYVVEVLFHALPLTLLVFLLGPLGALPNRDWRAWGCILIVSLLEPIFQAGSVAPDQWVIWREAYVFVHVFAFNALQLYVFRRFDFVSMYAFRLIYYGWWHIVWGDMRLSLIF